jgi:prevent-host-death family protein
MAKMALLWRGRMAMQSMSARDAKNSFGKLIDIARAEPIAIEKHGRTVVVVLSIEAYERLQSGQHRTDEANVIAPGKDFLTSQAAVITAGKHGGKS